MKGDEAKRRRRARAGPVPPLNVPFGAGAAGLAAARLLRRGKLEYRFTGELRFQTPQGGKGLPLDQRGTFRP